MGNVKIEFPYASGLLVDAERLTDAQKVEWLEAAQRRASRRTAQYVEHAVDDDYEPRTQNKRLSQPVKPPASGSTYREMHPLAVNPPVHLPKRLRKFQDLSEAQQQDLKNLM